MRGACDCCKFRGAETVSYHTNAGKYSLCGLCANTPTGNVFEYPREETVQIGKVLATICYVGNAILLAIERGKLAGEHNAIQNDADVSPVRR